MNQNQLHEAFARLQRLSKKIEERAGPGFVDIYEADDGQIHLHEVAGAKSPSEYKDELLNAILWAWSMKDYLKEAARSCGNDPKEIEELADKCDALGLISDLANGSKHGSLRQSRSGKFAKLGSISMSIPQSAIAKITVGANHLSTKVADPGKVKYSAPIVAENGEVLGDAGECLIEAIKIWEVEGLRCATGA